MQRLKTLFLGVALTVCASVFADSYSCLTITGTTGENNYAISSITKITFDTQNMILWNGDEQVAALPLSSLEKMQFTNNSAGIDALEIASKTSLRDGVLYVQAPSGSRITLFNLQGVAVKEVTASAEETEINLRGMVKGVYVVKVNDSATKIMNRSGR
jgi:hypothetical protein